MATLLLAAGGKGGVSVGGGGGGSNDDLTNWDGTKKKKGRSMSRIQGYINSPLSLQSLEASEANNRS